MKAFIITVIGAALIGGGAAWLALAHQPAPSVPKAGAVSGPVSAFNYFCNAGVCEYFGSAGLKQATSTACAIQSPAATSTLGSVAIRVDTASSTATNWFVGTGPTAFATTTAIGTGYQIASNAQGFIQASTSPGAGAATVIAPNTYVLFQNNLGITAGDAGTGFVPVGRCRASFVTTDQ